MKEDYQEDFLSQKCILLLVDDDSKDNTLDKLKKLETLKKNIGAFLTEKQR